MIRAKCDWVYRVPCLERAPAVLDKSRDSKPFYALFGANQYKKDSGSAR